ncbi:MAG: PD40 domain-containing protein [Bacteroidetes bacterium]|nr:PD40 domain-containing protein [Bacteroidota bacterium]
MKKYLIHIISIFLFCATSSFSQNVEFDKENFPNDKNGLKEAKRNISEGDTYYQMGNQMYNSALPLYLKANAFNPGNAMLNYKIGVCYIYSPYKQKAISHLEIAYKLNPGIVKGIHYYLGRAYQLNMDWDKAIDEYITYVADVDQDINENIDDVEKKITECKNGIELVKKPVEVTISNIGAEINSPYADYHPVISADESVMMFTSRRNNSTGEGIDPGDQMYYEDIYISTNENGKWTPARNIGKPVNTNDHDATLSLSADGQKLFIYLFDRGNGGGNIYECRQQGNLWAKPEKMSDMINTKLHESSASLSADGNILYFASNKEGGLGGHDIYRCVWDKKKKAWKPAENLGPVINTPFEEYGVFIHPDEKTLYFSSKGHNTMGGFDIFKAVWNKKQKTWSNPENIGYPINTPDDDVDYVVSASGKHAYYSSFKADGLGEKDIYKISFGKEAEAPTVKITILKGTICDALTKQLIEAEIELVDNHSNQVIATFKSNSTTGKYLVTLPSGGNYGIAVKKEGYLFHSENLDIADTAAYNEVTKDICLNNLSVGNKIVLRNIFYDFDKSTLRTESTAELERLTKLLTDIPTMKIEISGHTDSKGADDYNLKLSQSRAQSVVDYLIKNGITKNRLMAKGYGETQPISENDTDEGRQMNRRTEFQILSK